MVLVPSTLGKGMQDAMLKRPTILVVDDEPSIVNTLTAILEKAGFEARGAYSGRQAIVTARATRLDVLMIDVMMPDMNGVEVAAEVHSLMPECAVILFSGDLDNARALVTAYPALPRWEMLPKPLSPGELLERLERIADSRRPNSDAPKPTKGSAREA